MYTKSIQIGATFPDTIKNDPARAEAEIDVAQFYGWFYAPKIKREFDLEKAKSVDALLKQLEPLAPFKYDSDWTWEPKGMRGLSMDEGDFSITHEGQDYIFSGRNALKQLVAKLRKWSKSVTERDL